MLDPKIWEDPQTGVMPAKTRLLFIAMISQADDEGRGDADPALFRKLVFGFDVDTTVEEVETMLQDLAGTLRSFVLYEIGGRRYYALLNWKIYQTINRPSLSRIPAPPGIEPEPAKLNDIGKVYSRWESLTGTITSFQAQTLGSMVDDWNEHISKLPDGHPDKRVSGTQAVMEALDITGKSATAPYNLRYPEAILTNWRATGFKSKKPGSDKKNQPAPEAYSKEELEEIRKKARK